MLTVGKLKKSLRGVPNDMPVYTMDHDHSEWETNGLAQYAMVKNQRNMSDYIKEKLEDYDGAFKIDGPYFIIGT